MLSSKNQQSSIFWQEKEMISNVKESVSKWQSHVDIQRKYEKKLFSPSQNLHWVE